MSVETGAVDYETTPLYGEELRLKAIFALMSGSPIRKRAQVIDGWNKKLDKSRAAADGGAIAG